jgi:hypothetical protein
MNKKEINELAVTYASFSEAEKKIFLKNEKKRIESLSATENRLELMTIKNILQDLKNDIKSIPI